MEKLLELEKKLRAAKEQLEKAKGEYGPKTYISGADVIHPSKDSGNDDYDYRVHAKTGEVHKLMQSGEHKGKFIPMGHDEHGSQLKKSDNEDVNGSLAQGEKHPDEREDKRLIAEAIDTHNEDKHDEDKDEDSAYKKMKIQKEEGDVIKMEEISFAKNGQWSLEKGNAKSPNIPKGYKPVKPANLPSNEPKHIGTKDGISVHHAGKDEYGHNFHMHKDGKKIGSVQLDHKTKEIGTFGGGEDHDIIAAEDVVKEHIKKHPEKFAKGLGSKLDNTEHKAKVSQALGSIRQPAKVTNAAGETKVVSPKEQVADIKNVKANKASEAKAKAEAEAAARRASFKK